VIVVPRKHPLAEIPKPTLKQLGAYPLITYTFSFSGPSSLHQAFTRAGLTPDVAITARDSDVIKTYVRLGLGVGLVAQMAVNSHEDPDLVAIDASHLFSSHVTWIGFRRGVLLRKYMYDFVHLLAPHLDRRIVDRAHRMTTPEEVAQLFEAVELPQAH
jgi:LysR family cys regulon transcriptional activator